MDGKWTARRRGWKNVPVVEQAFLYAVGKMAGVLERKTEVV